MMPVILSNMYLLIHSASNGYVFDGTSQIMGMVAPGVVTDRLSWVTSSISNVGSGF